MPTIAYRNSRGEKVKGTTTIIGDNCAWGARALQWWYWSKGYEQIEYKDIFKHTGAEIGTVGHALITDYYLKGIPIPEHWPELSDEDYEKAKQAMRSFIKWAENYRFKPYDTEVNMVSEEYQYGLTPDIIGEFPEGLGLVDLKTGNGIYETHIIQMGAYFKGWHEKHPDEPLTQGIHVLRIGKENANFTHHWWAEFPPEVWEAFTHLKRLDEIRPIIKAMVK